MKATLRGARRSAAARPGAHQRRDEARAQWGTLMKRRRVTGTSAAGTARSITGAAQIAEQRTRHQQRANRSAGTSARADLMAPAAESSGTAGISAQLTGTEAPAARQPKLGRGGHAGRKPATRCGGAAPAERQPKCWDVENCQVCRWPKLGAGRRATERAQMPDQPRRAPRQESGTKRQVGGTHAPGTIPRPPPVGAAPSDTRFPIPKGMGSAGLRAPSQDGLPRLYLGTGKPRRGGQKPGVKHEAASRPDAPASPPCTTQTGTSSCESSKVRRRRQPLVYTP